MHLFKEMEKTFPTMEKVYRNLLAARYDGLSKQEIYDKAREAAVSCAIYCYLDEGSKLHKLFLRAGITDRRVMGYYIFERMLLNKRFNESRFNRADTSPAQE